jgi:hypothetical protein
VSGGDETTDVTIAVFAPDGTEVDPAPTPATADDGATWTVDVTYDATGWWLLTWTITGSGAGVDHERVFVAPDPVPGGPPAYATVPALRSYLKIEPGDGYDDGEMAEVLDEVSREIDSHCSRRFWADDTATARTFGPVASRTLSVHDFWTTTGLVIDGAAWPVSGVTLLPRNGVVDGLEGWPYTALVRPLGPTWSGSDDVTVTAKWGWERVPPVVRQSCLILAAATMKLREQPGGPGGFGEWGGIVKPRDNPHTTVKLAPYRLDPAVAL